MYIETSQNNSGSGDLFVSFERTDFVQISNFTFLKNRYSILTDKSKNRQVVSEFNYYWKIKLGVLDIDKLHLKMIDIVIHQPEFTVENYGIELIYDQIDTTHADMCFSSIIITLSL